MKWILCLILAGCSIFAHGATRPNFVFIQGEAIGWAMLSTRMAKDRPDSSSSDYHTPNLARLAEEGVRFSSFYAPSPRCTPSRVAYLTGRSPAQLHMTFISNRDSGGRVIMEGSTTQLSPEYDTIPSLLKAKGWTTAHFGKWHMGRIPPSEYGFDAHDGPNNNGGPENSSNPNPKQIELTTDKGVEFVKKAAAAGKPFYLQISHYAGRSAMDARPETMEFMRQRNGSRNITRLGHAAVVYEADQALGRILDVLEKTGVRENTHIFFTADHGSQGSNIPFGRGKGSVREGGLRVPLIWNGPGVRQGVFITTRTTGVDLLPTIAGLAEIDSLPKGLEGGSLVPALLRGSDQPVQRPFEDLVFHFPHYDSDPKGPASAIIHDDHKLIHYYETNTQELYDLHKDESERNDLAARQTAKVMDLQGRMTAYLKAVHAEIPKVDMTRPEGAGQAPKPREREGKGGGGGKNGKPGPLTTLLDQDGNGILSPGEIQQAAARIRAADVNKDGIVTQEEIRSKRRKR